MYQISAYTENSDISDQIYPKKVFLISNKKVNTIIEFHIFE